MKPGDVVRSMGVGLGTKLCSDPVSTGKWRTVGTFRHPELGVVIAFLDDFCDCLVMTSTGQLGWVDWSLIEEVAET